jgi:hypothetical protein
MLEKSSVCKIISLQKGGDSIMKKVLGLSLMFVLFATMSFGAITNYSFSTSLAIAVPGDGGNKNNGCVVYNPILNAAFDGQYFTGAGSRAVILGWSMDPLDPTYGTVTPKYIIRDRMFPNGDQLGALKSMYGNAELKDGKMYFVCDRWGFDNLNMVPRMYAPVNADSVSVTFPFVSSKYPLYNVTGVSTSATTAVEDTWGGVQLYAGTAVNTAAFTCEANGWQVNLIGSSDALVGVAGVYTDASGLGTNFYTGGGWDEANRSVWCNTQIPGAPTSVTVRYTDGKFNPTTGVIQITPPHPPGTMLFLHVGQLQPGHRAIWKYDATTLAAETALNIYGHPVMWEACTVAAVLSTSLVTTYEIGGMSAPVTDQFMGSRVPGANTAKSRLTYSNYGRDTITGTSLSATKIQLNVAGKPISGFYGIYTDSNWGTTSSQNFWAGPSFAGWVAVTDVNKVTCPWGPIKNVTGIFTDAASVGINFFTGSAGDTTSRLRGVGPGGYWSISPTTPEIFAAIGGIDTTLSLGSAWVVYAGEIPDNDSPIVNNLMDTTGIANLTIPLPGAAIPLWADVNRANGLDIANNRVKVAAAGRTPLLAVGDTAYLSYLKQAGANPYVWLGAGTAGNRGPNRNPYGMTIDKDGNYFLQTLWNDAGFMAYAANGDCIAKYPVRGSLSTVIRGQISCDTTNGDIYVADGGGIVWRWKKSGAGVDTYAQEDLPFYLGACKGTATAGLRAQTNALRVKTVTAQIGGSVTLVYLGTALNNNATTPGQDILTVMRTNGTIDAVYSSDALAAGPTPRGCDVTPDGKTVIFGNWAGPAGYARLSIWTSPLSPVPVELSRFETLVN